MPLRIVKASDPMTISNIVLTVYAKPSHGKSTLGFTAEAPLLLDFDKGAYRAAHRKDTVQVATWADVSGITAEDLAPYKTIIVDTAGRALDVMGNFIVENNPKAGKRGGGLGMSGYGELKVMFAQWKNFLTSLGKDIVMICHLDEQKQGDEMVERIEAAGSSKNLIYQSSDAMCRIQIEGNRRLLDFDPREGGFGKNPGQLPKIAFPHPDVQSDTLAQVIEQIKGNINRMTGEQAQAVKEQATWDEAINGAESVEDFNRDILPLMRERGGAFKLYAAGVAKQRGYISDKKTGVYLEPIMETAHG